MAVFTTTIRSICEAKAGRDESAGGGSVAEVIEAARPKIFDFEYPIFDDAYKPVIETKILRHYYTREIGLETVGLWKMFLETRLNEIMPYYNKLYVSELLDFDPLMDVDYTKTGNKAGSQNGGETSQGTIQATDAMTGTVVDDRDTTKRRSHEEEIVDDIATDNLRTDDLTHTEDLERFDDLIREDKLTRTDDLTHALSGTQSDEAKNDHWDYYSDTPQGAVDRLRDLSYLTNARHITDDGTGSRTETSSTDTNTGTVKNTGTVTNSGTVVNQNTMHDTGTVHDSGTTASTRTIDGSDSETGTDDNTRTYNTLDTRNSTDSSSTTRTLATTDEYLERVTGKSSRYTYAYMLKELRETYLNIDMLIIRDLNDLFMGLWE